MKTVKTYIVYWKDQDGNGHTEYFQALSATDAVYWLGIPEDQVVEVAVVLKDWKRSKS